MDVTEVVTFFHKKDMALYYEQMRHFYPRRSYARFGGNWLTLVRFLKIANLSVLLCSYFPFGKGHRRIFNELVVIHPKMILPIRIEHYLVWF